MLYIYSLISLIVYIQYNFNQFGFSLEPNAALDCSLFASVLEPAGPMKLSPEAQDWVTTSRDKPRKRQDRMVGYVLVSLAISWYVVHGCIFRCLLLFDPGSIAELPLFEVFSRMAKVYYKVVKDNAQRCPTDSFIRALHAHPCNILKVLKAVEGQAALASTFLSYRCCFLLLNSHSLFDCVKPRVPE